MLLLGGIMGVILIRAWLLEQPVDGSWPLTLGIAGAVVLGGGLVYGFLFPWMNSKIGRRVRIFDKGVYVGGIQVGFVAWALYPWEQVASAVLANVKIGQEVFPALVLYLRGGHRVSVGLSQKLPSTEVAAAVASYGVDVRNHLLGRPPRRQDEDEPLDVEVVGEPRPDRPGLGKGTAVRRDGITLTPTAPPRRPRRDSSPPSPPLTFQVQVEDPDRTWN
jgi:hypothetical protein